MCPISKYLRRSVLNEGLGKMLIVYNFVFSITLSLDSTLYKHTAGLVLYDDAVRVGMLHEPKCVEDIFMKVGYEDRFDETNARELTMSWCTAKVA
jgi:hypothetical protein